MFFTLILSSFLTFVELNCENLFDTKHDSLKNDYEFLPQSSYKWTPYRYWRKLANLSKAIVALGYEICRLLVPPPQIILQDPLRSPGMFPILWRFAKWRTIVCCLI